MGFTFRKPMFGLIEVLPCALSVNDLQLLKTRIKEDGEKKNAVFSIKKATIKHDVLKVDFTYDWTAFGDYVSVGEGYSRRVRPAAYDITNMSLKVQIKGIIILSLHMKAIEPYLSPPRTLYNLFSRLVFKPLWTIGVLKTIEQRILPNYFYERLGRIVRRDVWPRLVFHSVGKPLIDEKLLSCYIKTLEDNLKAEPYTRLRNMFDIWSNIVFLSIYCERMNVLLNIENQNVKSLICNYRSRISQLQCLNNEKLFNWIVEEVRWNLT